MRNVWPTATASNWEEIYRRELWLFPDARSECVGNAVAPDGFANAWDPFGMEPTV